MASRPHQVPLQSPLPVGPPGLGSSSKDPSAGLDPLGTDPGRIRGSSPHHRRPSIRVRVSHIWSLSFLLKAESTLQVFFCACTRTIRSGSDLRIRVVSFFLFSFFCPRSCLFLTSKYSALGGVQCPQVQAWKADGNFNYIKLQR